MDEIPHQLPCVKTLIQKRHDIFHIVDGFRNPASQLISIISHYLPGFCASHVVSLISSINNIIAFYRLVYILVFKLNIPLHVRSMDRCVMLHLPRKSVFFHQQHETSWFISFSLNGSEPSFHRFIPWALGRCRCFTNFLSGDRLEAGKKQHHETQTKKQETSSKVMISTMRCGKTDVTKKIWESKWTSSLICWSFWQVLSWNLHPALSAKRRANHMLLW